MNFNSLFIFIFYCFKFIFLLSNEELNEIEKKMILKDLNSYDNSKIIPSNTKLLFENVFKTIKIMIENKYKNLKFKKFLSKNSSDEKGNYYFTTYYHSEKDNYDENIHFLRCKAFGNVNKLDENITVYELEEIIFEDFVFSEILENEIKLRINEYHINKYHIENYKYNFIKKSISDNFDLIRLESDEFGPHYYYYLLVEYEDKIRIAFSARTPKYLIF